MVEITIIELPNNKLRSNVMNNFSTRSILTAAATVCTLLLVVGLPSLLRAQSFEGVVEYTVTTEEGTMPMTYMMKGDNVRVEMEQQPGRKAAILMDAKENKSIMLMDQMKMYMDLPAPPQADSTMPKPEITKTGKTQKILGYNCQQFLVKEGDRQSDVWVTKQLGRFQMLRMGGRGGKGNSEAWQKMIGSEGGFPLLAITKEGDSQVSKMEATKVDKKSLDASLFKIPEGYKKFDASMMGRPRQ
jgi:hypothetical protein